MNRIFSLMYNQFIIWGVPLLIFALSLRTSLYYADSLFRIQSDSLLEYQTYLAYIGHWWHPIIDNMLSSCLWTTYLPAVIQTFLKLPDPETVYRVTLAIEVAFLPVMVYILARRYTRVFISLLLTWIVFSSFYYQGFASYARMQVAVVMATLLLLACLSDSKHKYIYITLAVVGIVFAHYTTAYIYLGLFCIGAILLATMYLTKRHVFRHGRAVFASACILVVAVTVWYQFIVFSPFQYARSLFLAMVHWLWDGVYLHFTSGAFDIFARLPPDFVTLKVGLLIRFGVGLIGLIHVWKQGRIKHVIPILYAIVIVIGIVSVWSPVVAQGVGAARPSYILLPVEVMAVAWWWGKNKRYWAILLLFAWAWFYH